MKKILIIVIFILLACGENSSSNSDMSNDIVSKKDISSEELSEVSDENEVEESAEINDSFIKEIGESNDIITSEIFDVEIKNKDQIQEIICKNECDKPGQKKCSDDNHEVTCIVDKNGCLVFSKETLCDDNNVCTNEKCVEGKGCVYSLIDCSDDDPCTTDGCEPVKGCVHEKVDCDDSDPCTEDFCDQTTGCVHKKIEGCCNSDEECEDGDVCTQNKCENHSCVNYGKQNELCCNDSSECDDNNECTEDVCDGNLCVFLVKKEVPGCCDSVGDCDDNNPCTEDLCINNHCNYNEISNCCFSDSECDDGNECTDDICVNNQCTHQKSSGENCCNFASECDDGDPCTKNLCKDFLCKFEFIDGCCYTDDDCDDGSVCTKDICEGGPGGSCKHEKIPECCETDSDCDDQNPCTNDFCPGEGELCVHEKIEGCCTKNSDCDDNDNCTEDLCVNQQCVNNFICCTSDEECNDGNLCTEDKCEDGDCKHYFLELEGCCNPFFLKENFDKGELDGFVLQNSKEEVGWQLFSDGKSHSSPYALYYGNPEKMNFESLDGGANSGSIIFPKVLIPNNAMDPKLSFYLWCDTEPGGSYDKLSVEISLDNSEYVKLWQKDNTVNMKQWIKIEIPLNEYVGKEIFLKILFDTVDGIANSTEGLYVDDIEITQNCPVIECFENDDCNDNDPCTTDLCAQNSCTHEKIENCCISSLDCDDQNPCTQDECIENQCNYQKLSDIECNDDNPCTINDVCQNGVCSGEAMEFCSPEVTCDDLLTMYSEEVNLNKMCDYSWECTIFKDNYLNCDFCKISLSKKSDKIDQIIDVAQNFNCSFALGCTSPNEENNTQCKPTFSFTGRCNAGKCSEIPEISSMSCEEIKELNNEILKEIFEYSSTFSCATDNDCQKELIAFDSNGKKAFYYVNVNLPQNVLDFYIELKNLLYNSGCFSDNEPQNSDQEQLPKCENNICVTTSN